MRNDRVRRRQIAIRTSTAFAILCLVGSVLLMAVWMATDLQTADAIDVLLPLAMYFLVFVAAAGVSIAIWMVVGRLRGTPNGHALRPTSLALLVCAGIGFFAAAPVSGGWDDGCNGHYATFPVLTVPYHAMATPSRTWVAYGDASTSVGCYPQGSGGDFSIDFEI